MDPHHHKFLPDITATKGTKVKSSGIIGVPPQSRENIFTATKGLNLNTTRAQQNATWQPEFVARLEKCFSLGMIAKLNVTEMSLAE